jgi:hypothetical protein
VLKWKALGLFVRYRWHDVRSDRQHHLFLPQWWFVEWIIVQRHYPILLRSDRQHHVLLPQRWVAERIFVHIHVRRDSDDNLLVRWRRDALGLDLHKHDH